MNRQFWQDKIETLNNSEEILIYMLWSQTRYIEYFGGNSPVSLYCVNDEP